MDKLTSSATLTVGPQVLEKREAVLKRLLQRFEHVPTEVSLADELIAERRSEGRVAR
jgi:hypothetical protein